VLETQSFGLKISNFIHTIRSEGLGWKREWINDCTKKNNYKIM